MPKTIGLPLKRTKGLSEPEVIFKAYSNSIKSNADDYVYDFNMKSLISRVNIMIDDYRTHLGRWIISNRPKTLDAILQVDEKRHKWIRRTKVTLLRGSNVELEVDKFRTALYRPFVKRSHYVAKEFNEDIYRFPQFLPTQALESENRIICVSGVGSSKSFQTLIIDKIASFDLLEKTQCFPFYVYDEGRSQRARLGGRAVSGQDRRPQRHHQRPQPLFRRRNIHRRAGQARDDRQRRDRAVGRGTAGAGVNLTPDPLSGSRAGDVHRSSKKSPLS
jgi:predicted helicase